MAKLFDDTCGDTYNWTYVLNRWSISTTESGAGTANGAILSSEPGATGSCLLLSNAPFSDNDCYLRKNLPATYTRLIVGLRYKPATLPSTGYRIITAFWDNAGNMLVGLYVDASGRLALYTANYPVGGSGLVTGSQTAATLIQANTWGYIELDITLASGATGAFTLRFNSRTQVTGSSVVTSASSVAAAMFSVHSGKGNAAPNEGSAHYFDDVWVNDTSGSVNNGFDGDVQILAFFASAPGRLSGQAIGGSAPAATRWQSVNQTSPDDDVTYVSAATTGLKDTYKVPAMPANVITIVSVTSLLDTKTDTAGLGGGATVRPLIGNGTTEANGTSVSANTTYAEKAQNWPVNPLTSAAWALADWPNIEIGHERTA